MKLFAETCELLSKESSSLKKVEIICNALKRLSSDDELYLFTLYLTGIVYPASIQKTINVGKAWVRDAAIKLLGITKEKWEEEYSEYGETGETLEALMSKYDTRAVLENASTDDLFTTQIEIITNQEDTTSLATFKNYIEQLNQNPKSTIKVQIITKLLNKLTPLEAKYAAKLLLQRMRIGVQEPTVESAIAKAFDVEAKQVKHLNFYLGDIGEVAVRSKHKDFTNIEFRLFHPIRAMLASAEIEIEEIFKRMGEAVWAEYKYDGMRAHIHKSGDRVEIFTRDLKRVTDQFPEVAEAMKQIPVDTFLLDGEIIPFKNGKIGQFAELQKRLGRKEKIQEAVLENPMSYIAYDFLFKDGEALFDKPLKERRALLEKTFGNKLLYSTQKIVYTKEDFSNFFVESKNEGREGLVIKNPESKYESGKRGIHWLKYKQTLDPLDVVILVAEYGEGKNAKYLSNYTFGVWDEKKENLIPVGRVYSGATEENLKYFTKYLPTIAAEKLPRGFKLRPEIILEIGFENIQKSNRYSSGYAVRFPRILKIRTGDKPLEEISTIEDVKMGWEKLNT